MASQGRARVPKATVVHDFACLCCERCFWGAIECARVPPGYIVGTASTTVSVERASSRSCGELWSHRGEAREGATFS